MKSKTWFAIIAIFLMLGIVVQTRAVLQVWASSDVNSERATAWAIPIVPGDGNANNISVGMYTGAGWAKARTHYEVFEVAEIWLQVWSVDGTHYWNNSGVVVTAYGSNGSASSAGNI
ncbi:hypothetical protein C6499_16505 [Candidatus Poribacteria bacterium]|nr:MAG: hypothetical protein C6499_16505 [Candidatus Poribacteria bacterium]